MNYLPQFYPSYWTDDHQVFGIPFIDEISIGFVTRDDGAYSYLLKNDFSTLNVNATFLLDTSIRNLETEFESCEIKEYEIKGGRLVFWYSENDNFTAVRILSKKYLAIVKKTFDNDFNFSIPERDVISCWQTIDENENISLENETIEDFNDSEYGLSPKVYRYSSIKALK
jgi:uncharacterized protein YtpQ (UPF0354 family)